MKSTKLNISQKTIEVNLTPLTPNPNTQVLAYDAISKELGLVPLAGKETAFEFELGILPADAANEEAHNHIALLTVAQVKQLVEIENSTVSIQSDVFTDAVAKHSHTLTIRYSRELHTFQVVSVSQAGATAHSVNLIACGIGKEYVDMQDAAIQNFIIAERDALYEHVDAADEALQAQIDNLPPSVYKSGTGFNSIQPAKSVNYVTGAHTVVSGGANNSANSTYNTIGGGFSNAAGGGTAITIGGGYGNVNNSEFATIAGGNGNTIGAGKSSSTIGGGSFNRIIGYVGTIAGGANNTISAAYSSISGGSDNTANGPYSCVFGGSNNQSNGDYSSVNGHGNIVNGTDSHAYGCTDSVIAEDCTNVVLINCHGFSVSGVSDATYFNNQPYGTFDGSNLVHRTGDESIEGIKSFEDEAIFASNVYIGDGANANTLKIRNSQGGGYRDVLTIANSGLGNTIGFGPMGNGGGNIHSYAQNYVWYDTNGYFERMRLTAFGELTVQNKITGYNGITTTSNSPNDTFTAVSTSAAGSVSIGSFLAPYGGDTYFTVGKGLSAGQSILIGHSGGNGFITTYGRPATDFMITPNGNVGIGGGNLSVAGSINSNDVVKANAYLFGSDGRLDFVNGNAVLSANGTLDFTVTGDGIGIGTTSPDEAFHVVGNVKAQYLIGDVIFADGTTQTTSNDSLYAVPSAVRSAVSSATFTNGETAAVTGTVLGQKFFNNSYRYEAMLASNNSTIIWVRMPKG